MALAFNAAFYLQNNADVAAAIQAGTIASAFDHFVRFGQVEGRDPNAFFDTSFYLAQNADVNTVLTGTVTGGEANGSFDVLDHFNTFGTTSAEGRDPNENFDVSFYLANNADVAAAVNAGSTDALSHWNDFGRFETGRIASDLTGNLFPAVATGAATINVTTVGSAASVQGVTLNLTTGADQFTATTANDTISGLAGTLQSTDELNGGAGTDTLSLRLNASAAPVVSNIEIFDLIFRPAGAGDTAAIDFTDISGVTAVQVSGNSSGSLLNIGDTFSLSLVSGFDDAVNLSLLNAAGTDVLTLTPNGSASARVIGTSIETLNINVNSAYAGASLDLPQVNAINLSGANSGTTTLNLNTSITAGSTALGALTSISATGLVGALNLDIGFVGNIGIQGTTAGDVFDLNTTLNTLDVIAGGEGNDSLIAVVDTNVSVRPTVSGVESATVTLTDTAGGLFDARNITGMTQITVGAGDTSHTVDRLGAEVTNISVASAAAGGALTINHAPSTSATVTLNIGNSTGSTGSISAAAINYGNNGGSLTIDAIGNGNQGIGSFSAGIVTTLNVSLSTRNLTMSSLFATAADDVTLAGSAGGLAASAVVLDGGTGTLTITQGGSAAFTFGALSAGNMKTVSVTQEGGGALTIGTAGFASANSVTITQNGSGALTFGELQANSATLSVTVNGSGGVGLGLLSAIEAQSIDITTVGGNFSAGSASIGNTGTTSFNIAAGTGTTVTIGDINDGGAGFNGNINFVISGGGNVSLGTGADSFSAALGTAVVIDGQSHLGALTLQFSATTANAFDITLGGGGTASANFASVGLLNDTVAGGSAADTIEGGGGEDNLSGGAGNDTFLFLSSAGQVQADHTGSTGDLIQDFATGDRIIFSGIAQVTGQAGGTAVNTATLVRTASFTGVAVSTANEIAIFQSGGNTIIQLALLSGTHTSAGSGLLQITLAGFSFTNENVTTAFSINVVAGQGLTITAV